MKTSILLLILCLNQTALPLAHGADPDLRLALLRSPKELNPFSYLSLPEWYVHSNITATLVELDHQNQIVTGIAAKWTVEDDGKTYKFTLATDRKWSDGSPITAQDVLLSMHTAAKNKNQHFMKKVLRRGPLQESIFLAGNTLVFKLEAEAPAFLYYLAQPELGIVDVLHFEKTKSFSKTVRTSGDYRISQLTGIHLTLTPNQHSSRISQENPQSVEFILELQYPKVLSLIRAARISFYEAQSEDAIDAAKQAGSYEVVDGGFDNLATLQGRKLTSEQLHALQVFSRFFDRSLLVSSPNKVANKIVAASLTPPLVEPARIDAKEAKRLIGDKTISLTMSLGDEATSTQIKDAEIIAAEAKRIGIVIALKKNIKEFRKRYWDKEDYQVTMARMGVNTEDEAELMQNYFCSDYPPYRSLKGTVCNDLDEATAPGASLDTVKVALNRAYSKINASGQIIPLYHFPRRYLVQKKWELKDYNALLPFPIFSRFHRR